jgi:HlyD family secretion protein
MQFLHEMPENVSIMNGMDKKIEQKNKWIKKYMWPMGGFLIILLLLIRIVFGDNSSKYNVDANKITIEKVINDKYQDYISVIGTVEPIRTIYLDAIEGGRVEEILTEEGEMVEKGDPIIRLSNNNLLLEISNNEAQVARAINELRQARLLMQQTKLDNLRSIIEFDRLLKQQERAFKNNEKLYKNQHISNEDYMLSKEQYDASSRTLKLLKENSRQDSVFRSIQIKSLESSVRSLENNLGIIRNRLDALLVKAPVDGELATLNPEIGEVISYGTRVGIINILDSYKMRVEIDEHYVPRVIRGLTGEFEFAGDKHRLKLTKVYPEVQNGRFAVDMEFITEIPQQIRIGQTSRIRLELGESKNALLIPRGSFYQNTGGQWIYVVNESDEYAVKRDIRIGRQNPRFYEVLEGLEEGENVIVSGYDNFGNADKLILKNKS